MGSPSALASAACNGRPLMEPRSTRRSPTPARAAHARQTPARNTTGTSTRPTRVGQTRYGDCAEVKTPCRISPPRKSSVSAPATAGALARRTGRVALSHRPTRRIARPTDAAKPSELAALSIAVATEGFGQTRASLRGISAKSIHASASGTSATTNAPITTLSPATHLRPPPGNQRRRAANVMIQ